MAVRSRRIVWNCGIYLEIWSGRRDSNPRPQPWQGCALPLSYARSALVLPAGPAGRENPVRSLGNPKAGNPKTDQPTGCRLQARTIPSHDSDASISFDKITVWPGASTGPVKAVKPLGNLGLFSPGILAGHQRNPLRPQARSCIWCASRGRSARLMGPHRLEAQDGALSRRKPGFESPWGRQLQAYMSVLAIRFRVLRAP